MLVAHRCSFPEGTGWTGFAESAEDGRRKGRAPLGDAWLFADATWHSIPENLR